MTTRPSRSPLTQVSRWDVKHNTISAFFAKQWVRITLAAAAGIALGGITVRFLYRKSITVGQAAMIGFEESKKTSMYENAKARLKSQKELAKAAKNVPPAPQPQAQS